MSVDTPIPSRVETPDASPPQSRARRARQLLTARPKLTALVAVLLAAAVTGAVVATVLLTGDDKASAQATTTTSLVAVSTGTVRASVSASGTIAAADITDVSFGSSAEVTSVKVAQGDTVAKGQVLGTIDTVALRASLADAKATLASARSTLTDAEDDDDTSDAQLAADEASVTSAKQDVAIAEDALADATLRSPIAGTVASVNVATGDTATGGTSGSSSGSGGTASGSATTGASDGSDSSSASSGDFVIAGLKKWTVSASLDDTEIGLVAKGDQVQITTDSGTATTSNAASTTASNTPSIGTGGTVFGTVTSVSVLSSGSSDSSGSGSAGSSSSSGSATYPVGIAVTGSPSGLHDGASATVSIIYKQATNVLTVPTTAVNRSGTTSFVYVSRNGTKTKQTITTGLASGGTTQVTSGLTTSDKVYVTTIARRSTGTSGSNEGNRTRQGNTNGGGFPGGGTGGFPGGGTGGFPGGGQGGSR